MINLAYQESMNDERVHPPLGLVPKEILLKLFLDMVPSSPADFYCNIGDENAHTDYLRK